MQVVGPAFFIYGDGWFIALSDINFYQQRYKIKIKLGMNKNTKIMSKLQIRLVEEMVGDNT